MIIVIALSMIAFIVAIMDNSSSIDWSDAAGSSCCTSIST